MPMASPAPTGVDLQELRQVVEDALYPAVDQLGEQILGGLQRELKSIQACLFEAGLRCQREASGSQPFSLLHSVPPMPRSQASPKPKQANNGSAPSGSIASRVFERPPSSGIAAHKTSGASAAMNGEELPTRQRSRSKQPESILTGGKLVQKGQKTVTVGAAMMEVLRDDELPHIPGAQVIEHQPVHDGSARHQNTDGVGPCEVDVAWSLHQPLRTANGDARSEPVRKFSPVPIAGGSSATAAPAGDSSLPTIHLTDSSHEGKKESGRCFVGTDSDSDDDVAPKDVKRWDVFRSCERMVMSPKFDYFICFVIAFNAAMIGAQTDWSINNHHKNDVPRVFTVFEWVFGMIFTLELLLRLAAFYSDFFTCAEWRWNVFDLVVVGLQWVDIIAEASVGAREVSGNFNFMRILRVLRLLRVIRLVRIMRFFQELRSMVSSIASSCQSLLWTIVLVLLLIYIVGVYVTNTVAEAANEHPSIMEDDDILRYFGSLWLTILSLFQAMTGGVDWGELSRPLQDRISPVMSIIFSLYITFAVLCMMNVITGVFVESSLLTAKRDKDREIRQQVESMFQHLDVDKNGMLSWDEFARALSDKDWERCFQAMNIDPSEATGVFALLDTDNSGEIDAQEFVTGCLRLHGEARAIDLVTLMYFNKRVSAFWSEHITYLEDGLEELHLLLEDMRRDGSVSAGGNSPQSPGPGSPSRRSFMARRESRLSSEVDGRRGIGSFATWEELKIEGLRRAEGTSPGGVAGGRASPQRAFAASPPGRM